MTSLPETKSLPKKALTTDYAMNQIRGELNTILILSNVKPSEVAGQLDRILSYARPVIDDAVQQLDLTTLRFVRDQIAPHFQRTSHGQVIRSLGTVLTNTIITTLSMMIKATVAGT